MSKLIVRVGDSLKEYGGSVIDGHYCAFGKGIACVGNKVVCNKHGVVSIVEGWSGLKIDNQAIALDGCKCSCGCTLVSSFADFLVG